MKKQSEGELVFAFQLKAVKIKFETEYKFHPDRKWRFDFVIPEKQIAIEIEGGIYQIGRHQRPTGFLNDCEKYNNAQLLGWRVYRFVSDQVFNGEAINFIVKALKEGKNNG